MDIPKCSVPGRKLYHKYLTQLLYSFSWGDILSEDVLQGKVNIRQRDVDLGLPAGYLHRFLSKCRDVIIRESYLEWKISPFIKQTMIQNRRRLADQTVLSRYGVSNVSQFEEVKSKKAATSLRNYGVSNPMQSPIIKSKMIDASLRKWGVEYPNQSNIVRSKVKATNQKLYGADCFFQSAEFYELTRQKTIDRWNMLLNCSDCLDWKSVLGYEFTTHKKSFTQIISNSFEVDWHALWQFYHRTCPDFVDFINSDGYTKAFSRTSTIERDLIEHYKNLGFEAVASYAMTSKKEIDLYFPVQKIGFEFNGYWSHCTQFGRSKNYHKDKTTEALSQGIKLYHLWYGSSEDKDIWGLFRTIIDSRLGLFSTTLSAGSLKCQRVDSLDAYDFHRVYHYHRCPILRKSDISFGLYHKNHLVSVVSWRITGDHKVENIRYTVRSGYSIHYGFQKLLWHSKLVLSSLGFSYLVSYCDRDLSPDPFSTVYHRSGFLLQNLDCFPLHLSYYATKRISDSVGKGNYSRQTFQRHKLNGLGIQISDGESSDTALGRVGVFPCYNSGVWKYYLDAVLM